MNVTLYLQFFSEIKAEIRNKLQQLDKT